MSDRLSALDESRIENPWTPEQVALEALRAFNAEDLAGATREILATGARDHYNESNIAPSVALPSENLWSRLAEVIRHDPDTARFRWLADAALSDAARNAEHAVGVRVAACAAEIGRALSRHVSEAVLADEIGRVAPSSAEGEGIDVITTDGLLVQVTTCFPGSDSTTGKSAKDKKALTDEKVERLDRYVVLHEKNGEFGVGVNNLNENGRDTEYAQSASAKANRA